MSESGEVSEFGYIMELLARGKVSAGARGAAAWVPPPTPPRAPSSGHYLACGCRCPGPWQPPGRAGLESQVRVLSQDAQPLLKANQTSDLPPSPPPLIARHL